LMIVGVTKGLRGASRGAKGDACGPERRECRGWSRSAYCVPSRGTSDRDLPECDRTDRSAKWG
jgi:hypothetical protein